MPAPRLSASIKLRQPHRRLPHLRAELDRLHYFHVPSETECELQSETPRFVERALAALAAGPQARKKSGRVLSSWALAREYRFADVNGARRAPTRRRRTAST
jgi:hypothetical protein